MSHEYHQTELSLARSQADVQAMKEELERATETIHILQISHAHTVRLLRNVERDYTTQQNNHRLYMVRQAILRRNLTAIYETQARQLQKENEELHAAVNEARDEYDDLKIGYDVLEEHLAMLTREQPKADFEDVAQDFREQRDQPDLSTVPEGTNP